MKRKTSQKKILDDNTLVELRAWFSDYTESVYTDSGETNENITVKRDHTYRVCREAVNISKKLGFDRELVFICEIAALLHDSGRFEQFVKYNTFVDKKSEDHAVLALRLIERKKILDGIEPRVRSIILFAVEHHNKAALPKCADDPDSRLVLQVLRDADKLDIFKVLTDYYGRSGSVRNSGIELGLPDTPGVSPKVLEDISESRIVNIDHIINFNDFKALQMSWIFDINFDYTFEAIKQRKYLELISSAVSDREASKKLYSITSKYLNNIMDYCCEFPSL